MIGVDRDALHVITRRKLLEASTRHPELTGPLDLWYRLAKRAAWISLQDVRKDFPSADDAGKFTIFNIKGNHFRLIVEVNYGTGRIFIRHVLTHAEYSKGVWKP
jgi:mRNA interferase HigB